MKKSYMARVLLTMILAVSLCFGAAGCGKKQAEASATEATAETKSEDAAEERSKETAVAQVEDTADEQETQDGTQTGEASDEQDEEAADEQSTDAPEQETADYVTLEEDAAPETDSAVPDEDGVYTSKDDVALYIHVYGKLPSNFISKKQAKKLGWSGGSLEDYAPGKCIGGDYFGNYEGLLPTNREYHECDIDTLGKKGRGAKRIVYSDDGYIYYTGDHYESFELLYSPS